MLYTNDQARKMSDLSSDSDGSSEAAVTPADVVTDLSPEQKVLIARLGGLVVNAETDSCYGSILKRQVDVSSLGLFYNVEKEDGSS